MYLTDEEKKSLYDEASKNGEGAAFRKLLSMLATQAENASDDINDVDSFLEEYTKFTGDYKSKLAKIVKLVKDVNTIEDALAETDDPEAVFKLEESRRQIIKVVEHEGLVFDALLSFDFNNLAKKTGESIDSLVSEALKALVELYYSDTEEIFYEYGNFFAINLHDRFMLMYAIETSYNWY